MEFDTLRLEALLDILVTSGVEEFEGYGFHIRFTPTVFTPERIVGKSPAEEVVVTAERREPGSIWEQESLWPGGKPPGFPGK